MLYFKNPIGYSYYPMRTTRARKQSIQGIADKRNISDSLNIRSGFRRCLAGWKIIYKYFTNTILTYFSKCRIRSDCLNKVQQVE